MSKQKKKSRMMLVLGFMLGILITGCQSEKREKDDFIDKIFATAEEQYKLLAETSENIQAFPRTLNKDGNVKGTNEWDWTGGFFPGALWYVYQHAGSEEIKENAIQWTEALEAAKDLDRHHDIGFVMYCSYGNAVRFLKDEQKMKQYNAILIHSAETALKRYDPQVGLIKSWNEKAAWDGKTIWKYPVIIDNMMNLEMLCYVSNITGDPKYKKVAINHATKTMENHFRDNYSTYHVVDYDSVGNAIHRQTNQGYADNSTWSRGQAWAIYGFTMMYRETKDPVFLTTAQRAADFYINHPNLPEDKIPYWDFNVGEDGYKSDVDFSSRELDYIPRDASAAAITASALIELSQLTDREQGEKYRIFAKKTLQTLSSPEYFAEKGTNGGFLLKHCVGSFPHNSEIDVPLIYADYYYLEALVRFQTLLKK